METIIKYLRKGIKKYSDDIAYIIVVGVPFLLLSVFLCRDLDVSNLY
jgi:hypothetical protein